MIRGYNFPSGSEEKVTIDDYKVTEKMNLYTYSHTMDFKLDTAPTNLKFPSKNGSSLALLPDESVLEYPSSPGNMGYTYGSSNPTVTKFTSKFNLYKKDGTKLTINTPNYTIPSTSQNGTSSANRVEWNSITVQNHLGDVYIIIEREFMQNRNSSSYKYGQSYVSVWKLNITSTEMSWTQKCLEIPLTDTDAPKGPPNGNYQSDRLIYIDDNNLIMYGTRASWYDPCVYMLRFGETIFSNVPIGSISNLWWNFGKGSFTTKLNNTIYCYLTEEDVTKAWEIDYNTKTIIQTLTPTAEFQTIAANGDKTGFVKNNKLYFTYLNTTNSIFTMYEFNPTNWSFTTKTTVNGINNYQLFMNHVPRYVSSDTQIQYFNPNNHLETMGPYMLPELIDQSQDGLTVDSIQKRYYFLPTQGYILTYVQTALEDYNYNYHYDYRVYIRRLDNKPLIYTTLLEAVERGG